MLFRKVDEKFVSLGRGEKHFISLQYFEIVLKKLYLKSYLQFSDRALRHVKSIPFSNLPQETIQNI